MFWGQANVTDANIALVQQLKTQGQAKYVLGFNEPDQSGQSNMTVSQALALWPKLDSLPYVERYSWFSGDPASAALWPSALIGSGGQLTTLGSWYASYQPNAAIKQ